LGNNSNYASFKLETFSLNVTVLLNVPPCFLADTYQHFRYTCTFPPKRWFQFSKLHGGTFQRTAIRGDHSTTEIMGKKSSLKIITLHCMKLINFLPSQAMWCVTDYKIKTQCGLQTCRFLPWHQFKIRSIAIYLHTRAEENYIHAQYLYAYITTWSL